MPLTRRLYTAVVTMRAAMARRRRIGRQDCRRRSGRDSTLVDARTDFFQAAAVLAADASMRQRKARRATQLSRER